MILILKLVLKSGHLTSALLSPWKNAPFQSQPVIIERSQHGLHAIWNLCLPSKKTHSMITDSIFECPMVALKRLL